jgi:hypothetical protein
MNQTFIRSRNRSIERFSYIGAETGENLAKYNRSIDYFIV